jgi:transcriptional regulator with XRE-family HTH domain
MPKVTPEAADVARRVRGHLRQQMAERGLNQSALAKRLGLSRQALSQLLTGERGIGVGTILRVSGALHITPTRLMEEDPDPRFADPPPVTLP